MGHMPTEPSFSITLCILPVTRRLGKISYFSYLKDESINVAQRRFSIGVTTVDCIWHDQGLSLHLF